MADSLTIGHTQDVNARGGKSLNTGSVRRSYNTKKKKKSSGFRICNNKYVEGK